MCCCQMLSRPLETQLETWSSLIYNTSARHERHECDTSDTNASLATRVQRKWDTSDTSAVQVRHECFTKNTSARRVKNFDFDNNTSKNIFSHHYIYYMASKRLKAEVQFHSTNLLLEMPCSHAKMRLKSAPQKLNFLMAKAISKLIHKIKAANALARSHIVTHSNAVSFSIKTILCENTNISFSKNYWKLGKMNATFWKNI